MEFVSDVPQDYADLWAKHQRFFLYVVRGIVGNAQDVEDIVHDAVVAAMSRKFLQGCREYEQACLVQGKPYKFLSTLRPLVENITRNYRRDQMAAKRDYRKVQSLQATLDTRHDQADRVVRTPVALRTEATQHQRACAVQRSDRLRQRLAESRCVIGGVPAVEVFDRALQNGGELDKYPRRRIKHVLGDEAHA